jgi:hypothetical protein
MRTLPPMLKLPQQNEEDENNGPATSGRKRSSNMRDMFYPPSATDANTGRRGSSVEGASKEPTPIGLQINRLGGSAAHNRSTATPLFSYQTSSDEEGGSATRTGKIRPQKIMRLLNKYANSNTNTSALIGIPNAPVHQPT